MIILYEPFFIPDFQTTIVDRCEAARRDCKGALGFIPRSAYESAVKKRRMLVAADLDSWRGEAFVGFVIWTQVARGIKIMQLYVEDDWRRQRIGTKLIRSVERWRKETDSVTLRVRSDFEEANRFWKANGYTMLGQDKDSNKSLKPINIYHKDLKPLKGKRS